MGIIFFLFYTVSNKPDISGISFNILDFKSIHPVKKVINSPCQHPVKINPVGEAGGAGGRPAIPESRDQDGRRQTQELHQKTQEASDKEEDLEEEEPYFREDRGLEPTALSAHDGKSG